MGMWFGLVCGLCLLVVLLVVLLVLLVVSIGAIGDMYGGGTFMCVAQLLPNWLGWKWGLDDMGTCERYG